MLSWHYPSRCVHLVLFLYHTCSSCGIYVHPYYYFCQSLDSLCWFTCVDDAAASPPAIPPTLVLQYDLPGYFFLELQDMNNAIYCHQQGQNFQEEIHSTVNYSEKLWNRLWSTLPYHCYWSSNQCVPSYYFGPVDFVLTFYRDIATVLS